MTRPHHSPRIGYRRLPRYVQNHEIAKAAAASQIIMTPNRPARLIGRSLCLSASLRNSDISGAGTNRIAKAIPSGTISKSSRYPRIGMKSGIRSIGERAYAATLAAAILATIGVRLSRAASQRATISRFSDRAQRFNLLSHPSTTWLIHVGINLGQHYASPRPSRIWWATTA